MLYAAERSPRPASPLSGQLGRATLVGLRRIQHLSNCTLSHLVCIFVRCRAHKGPTLSGAGASGKHGAVHSGWIQNRDRASKANDLTLERYQSGVHVSGLLQFAVRFWSLWRQIWRLARQCPSTGRVKCLHLI
jgi:hypothetical protein